MAAPHPPVDGDVFHRTPAAIYDGDVSDGTGGGPAPGAVVKRGDRMQRVVYRPAHRNDAFPEGDDRAGHGETVATWVFSEQAGTADGLFRAPLDVLHDTRVAPGAAIGLHLHDRTEEVYYVLEGALTMTTVLADGRVHSATLGPGDAHAVRLGQSHGGVAGPEGCRLIVVNLRAG